MRLNKHVDLLRGVTAILGFVSIYFTTVFCLHHSQLFVQALCTAPYVHLVDVINNDISIIFIVYPALAQCTCGVMNPAPFIRQMRHFDCAISLRSYRFIQEKVTLFSFFSSELCSVLHIGCVARLEGVQSTHGVVEAKEFYVLVYIHERKDEQ